MRTKFHDKSPPDSRKLPEPHRLIKSEHEDRKHHSTEDAVEAKARENSALILGGELADALLCVAADAASSTLTIGAMAVLRLVGMLARDLRVRRRLREDRCVELDAFSRQARLGSLAKIDHDRRCYYR